MDYANSNRPTGVTLVYIIPGHRMMARLYDDIQLDIIPEITPIDDFFEDTIHPNTLGVYAVAMIHYACIYNESPVRLTNNLMPDVTDFEAPSEELPLYLQTMIWEVVTNYSRTGITNTALSIDNNTLIEKNFKIYPNPASEILFITTNSDALKKVEVNNNIGTRVYSEKTEDVNYNLDISSFATGTYFLKVYTSESILHKKILID